MKVIWKPYQTTTYAGEPMTMGEHVDDGSTLNKIMTMPKKKPISYQMAESIFWDDIASFILAGDPSITTYPILGKMPEWISDLGYHIVLTGTEYEIVPSERSQ